MTLAYLILAHGNYRHLERLINAMDGEGAHFFIHIDAKSPLPDFPVGDNVHFIPNRVKVTWANFSQVEATLKMMRAAQAVNPDYYLLISGADYPIRPTQFLLDKLNEGGQFINFVKGPVLHKSPTRVTRYHFSVERRNPGILDKIWLLAEKVLARVYVRKFPFGEPCYGSTWWALSRDCVHYILDKLDKNPAWLAFYRHTLAPDEGLFQTLISQSPFAGEVKTNLTYTEWVEGEASPATLGHSHVDLYKKQTEFEGTYGPYTPFFARKFDDASADVIERIEGELRG